MRRAALLLTLPILLAVAGSLPVTAQERLVPRTGEAQVAIYQDDLDQARRRAVARARREAVRGLLAELLAPEWFTLFQEDLEQRILGRLDQFVSAFRVSRLETSLDRTQYFAEVEAQVDRARLLAELRAMDLPIRGESPVPLHLVYAANDPVLQRAAVRQAVLDALTARLELLNLRLTRVQQVPPNAAALMEGGPSRQAARADWLGGLGSPAPVVALLSFAERPPAPEAPPAPAVRMALFLVRDGSPVTEFTHHSPDLGSQAIGAVLEGLMGPLLERVQPGTLGNPRQWGTQVSGLALRVFGFRSIYQEERLERELFGEGGPFAGFVLSRIDGESVTYEGEYRGDRQQLPANLRGKPFGGLVVADVFWHNDVLELRVGETAGPPRAELRPFPDTARRAAVQAVFEESEPLLPEFALEQPVLSEVEDNGQFDRANPIVFDTAIYGHVDSRADSDLFIGEELMPGETIEVEWYRLGRSNLNPVLRFYDAEGTLRDTAYLRRSGRARYTIPEGQHTFYLEGADRYGYLDWDTGGYLNYHYLMWVRRLDGPATARAGGE